MYQIPRRGVSAASQRKHTEPSASPVGRFCGHPGSRGHRLKAGCMPQSSMGLCVDPHNQEPIPCVGASNAARAAPGHLDLPHRFAANDGFQHVKAATYDRGRSLSSHPATLKEAGQPVELGRLPSRQTQANRRCHGKSGHQHPCCCTSR